MDEQTYNGWANYQTWAIYTWLTNEYLLNLWFEKMAQTLTKNELIKHLKHVVEECNPLINEASFYSDILERGLCDINYNEIAEGFRGE